MLNIVLFEPEIPPNTGNILRLAHNSGFFLHLIEPLGFDLSDQQLKRAGLDYIDWNRVALHSSWDEYLGKYPHATRYAITTKGTRFYHEACFCATDHLVFGPETRGLPPAVLESFAPIDRLRIPMIPESRSLNLSNAVALTLYEAWRQLDFEGAI